MSLIQCRNSIAGKGGPGGIDLNPRPQQFSLGRSFYLLSKGATVETELWYHALAFPQSDEAASLMTGNLSTVKFQAST